MTMTKATEIREAVTVEREAVTMAAKATLASAVTMTKRTAVLADALATMREATEAAGGTFRQYVTEATEAIREAGDWTKADTEARKAVAAVAGTTGGLSSVMVAEAVGLSQATASRAIRAAKAVTVTEATEAAKAEAEAKAEADGLTGNDARQAIREAAEAAKAKAEAEAARVITRSGLTMAASGGNGSRVRSGRSVLSSLTDGLSSLSSLTDGTVTAEDMRALAVRLAEAAEAVGRTMADDVAKAEAEAKREAEAAEAAKAEAKREAEAAKAEAKAARQAEREAKADALAVKREAKRVRPVLALTMGDDIVAAMDDETVIARGRIVAEAATLALTEATA